MEGGVAEGRFPEGGLLDRLDKAVSRPIFHLALPVPLEVALTIPGSWFGCPVYALGVSPLLLVLGAARERTPAVVAVGGFLAAAGASAWLRLCHSSLTRGAGLTYAYRVAGKRLILALPSGVMAVAGLGHKDGAAAAALYMASWHVTQLLCEVLKASTRRLRPAVVLEEELQTVHRAIPELGNVVKDPSQAYSSFPSGDAAGGACFSSSLVLATGTHGGVAAAVFALSGVGRVYFHCHHLLDVLVGQAVGVGVTFAMSRGGTCGWGHVLAAQLFLIALWKPAQWLKPKNSKKVDLAGPGSQEAV